MTDQQFAEIMQGQLEAIQILRTEIWTIKLVLTRKLHLLDATDYAVVRKEVEEAMASSEEIAELERLLELGPDKPSEEPSA